MVRQYGILIEIFIDLKKNFFYNLNMSMKEYLKPFFYTCIYALLGVLWIFLTDKLILSISQNIENLTKLQGIKGFLYIIITGIGLYLILLFYNKKILQVNKQLEKKSKLLKTLSLCNQILIKSGDEKDLLNQICELIVKEANYKMVWIGYKENDESKSVKPVAFYGFENGYLESIKISWDDNEYGKGPTGTALRTGKTVIAKNIRKLSEYKPWLNAAIKRGYTSSAAIPIIVNNEALGSLNIYSQSEDAFDTEEIRLLEEMAMDIGYGIMERRQRQRLLDDYIKIKEVDKLKTNFLSIISHELRTPLTPIKGYNEVLLKEWRNIKNPEDYLLTIKSNIIRLQEIINDLVDISRIEKGIIELKKEKINLIKIINNAINDMKFLLEKNKNKIITDYEKEEIILNADEFRIGQVIINLINNAIKFSKMGTEILVKVFCKYGNEIKTPEIFKKQIFQDKLYAIMSIRDYGYGIEKTKIDKIFEKFYQVDDVLTRKASGLGLGLSIAKYIVEAHDGIIWAESEGKDKGSVFVFALPCPE